jgi:hypothetical protein
MAQNAATMQVALRLRAEESVFMIVASAHEKNSTGASDTATNARREFDNH